jgi:pyrimidine-specific ribonucleoside hydrolase
MGPDDWGAMLFLLKCRSVSVDAVSVVGSGESSSEKGVEHALQLIELAKHSPIPVGAGLSIPSRGANQFPAKWREEADQLLGIELPPVKSAAKGVDGVKLMLDTIHSASAPVDLLALGPLTDVAELLDKHPSVRTRLRAVYIMGGAVKVAGNLRVPGGVSNNGTAEWNMYIDPHAANLVFGSGVKVTLIPLDATDNVPVSRAFYSEVEREQVSPETKFIFQVMQKNEKEILAGQFYFWDQLAAAVLEDEELASFKTDHLCVVEEPGPEQGRLIVGKECPLVRYAYFANASAFRTRYVDALSRK